MLVGLEVQVGCPHVEGVQQHLVQELDDGSIFYIGSDGVVFFLGGILDLDVIKVEITGAGVGVKGFADAFAGLVNELVQLVGFNDYPVHEQLGGELDLLGRFLLRGVGGGNRQSVAALAQGQDAVGAADLGIQQFARQLRYIHGVQVQQRCAEHGGDRLGDFQGADFAGLTELRNKRGFAAGSFFCSSFGRLL